MARQGGAGITMATEYDKTIRDHYRAEADRHGNAASSTMADLRIRELETELILRFVGLVLPLLPRGSAAPALCEVGCGNGYTLEAVHRAHEGLDLRGYELSPELRALAEERHGKNDKVRISAGDIRRDFNDEIEFDVLLCQRVLINLLDRAHQVRALSNIVSAVRPGGYLLFVEAFGAPLERLNEARHEFALDPISPAHHNLYLSDDIFVSAAGLERFHDPALPANFLSSHYFVSRVLHAAMTRDQDAKRNSHFVRFFSEALAAPVGDYAPVRALAFRKLP